ncbi:MAG: valine--tRNA ligase [Holosporales bacterium]|jgi:valyl-tRNA synthetase|nr:valine--tRNA ligase [Holosporales bacterium]
MCKQFDHNKFEPQIVEKSKKVIAQTVKSNVKTETFTITLPPPNVTGSLHLGHAFTSVIQDMLLRYKRQHGYVTLGQPGLDHAGIATQIIVANQLQDQGINWQELGRDEFIDRVWKWKEQSGGTILYQLVRLGMSIDLDRVRFTMDDDASNAVLYAFTTLYKDGLIYRAKKIVNWDPILKTAISDIEVSNKTQPGKMWYIKYPIGTCDFITIATTRPETVFGDQALAVHPDDERYKHLIGKKARIPLTDKSIPIIADDYCDREKGSGVFKVTPAHDFADFEIGQRHNLHCLSIMDEAGRMNDEVPEEFRGLPGIEARKKLIKVLLEKGLLERTEDIVHSVPYNNRSGAIIEPMVTNQWFLDTKVLAEAAIKAVETGRIRFVPEQWANTYFEWLRNIQPWCLSRQILWGHQIPVWHAENGKMFCAMTEAEAKQQAKKYFDVDEKSLPKLTRDPDVLDTWFSSALWPFVTLGWPRDQTEMRKHYPTDVLVTGFDIIFFWVARMVMFGLYFAKEVPFKVVYINPLVRDEHGQKMSKSKGNVIDPLHLMDKYGTDALRLTLATLAVPGRDVNIGESHVEIGRNFVTKMWNASKFLEMKGYIFDREFKTYRENLIQPLNKWIVRKLIEFKRAAQSALDEHRFDLYAQSIHKFLKDVFCDTYIEAIKLCDDEETRKTACSVFLEYLKVAHPVIPFVTEYLWEKLTNGTEQMLLISPWTNNINDYELKPDLVDHYISVAGEVRSLKGLIGCKEKLDLLVKSGENDAFVSANEHWIRPLARVNSVELVEAFPARGIRFFVAGQEFFVKYPHEVSRSLFDKKLSALTQDMSKLTAKIENESYKKAKPEEWQNDVDLLAVKKAELQKMEAVNWCNA